MKKIACIFSYEITKGMKSFGPKGLLKSKKSSELINHQIKNLKGIVDELCVIVGFGSDKLTKKIKTQNINILQNNNYDKLNEGYSIQLLLDTYADIEGLLVISNGLLLDLDNIELETSTVITTNNKSKNFNIGCIVDHNNTLENMFYDISNTCWCEAVYFQKKELDMIRRYSKTTSIKNMFLFELINTIIIVGGEFNVAKIASSKVVKIQSVKDTKKIKEFI